MQLTPYVIANFAARSVSFWSPLCCLSRHAAAITALLWTALRTNRDALARFFVGSPVAGC